MTTELAHRGCTSAYTIESMRAYTETHASRETYAEAIGDTSLHGGACELATHVLNAKHRAGYLK